jgi:hypothetical protein
MMLSPCLSPSPSTCPTIAQAALVRVNASRAASHAPGSEKRDSSHLPRRGGSDCKTRSSSCARLPPATQTRREEEVLHGAVKQLCRNWHLDVLTYIPCAVALPV